MAGLIIQGQANMTMNRVENWPDCVDFEMMNLDNISIVQTENMVMDYQNINRDVCVHTPEADSNSSNIYYKCHSLHDNSCNSSLPPSPNLNNHFNYTDNIVDVNYSGTTCKELPDCTNETNAFLFQNDPLLESVVVRLPLSTSDSEDTSETQSSYYNVDNVTDSFKDLSTKSKLKTAILNRCWAEGKDIKKILHECHESTKVEIMPSALEMAKENDRKERNRQSAKRSRDLKKACYDEIKKKHEELVYKNEEEKKVVQELTNQARVLEEFINTHDLHPKRKQEIASAAMYDTDLFPAQPALISSTDSTIQNYACPNILAAQGKQSENDISLSDYSENEIPGLMFNLQQPSHSQSNQHLADTILSKQQEINCSETSDVELSPEIILQILESLPIKEPSNEQYVSDLQSNEQDPYTDTDIQLDKKKDIRLSLPMEPETYAEISQEQYLHNSQEMVPVTITLPLFNFQQDVNKSQAEIIFKQSESHPQITNHHTSGNDYLIPPQLDSMVNHYNQNVGSIQPDNKCTTNSLQITAMICNDMTNHDMADTFCTAGGNVHSPVYVPINSEGTTSCVKSQVDFKISSKASLDVWRVDSSAYDEEMSDLTSSFLDEPQSKKRKINNDN
uniref:BZIP domain-containing protein n=2 Tax=Biomphalaria glabrata TaxID=6526 RepID=A0A2C9M3V1_BIOGL